MAMRFISAKKLNELLAAAKNGDAKAKNIIDKYMDDNPDMDSIERLLNDYYGLSSPDEAEKPVSDDSESETADEPVSDDEEPISKIDAKAEAEFDPDDPDFAQTSLAVEEEPIHGPTENPEPVHEPEIEEESKEEEPAIEEEEAIIQPVDISADLDRELDGLLDTDEVDGISFSDFLKRKSSDALRARKNNGYFKAFDAEGRKNYLSNAIDKYKKSFDVKRRNVERGVTDMDNALGKYGDIVTDFPDDDSAFDADKASKAYSDMTTSVLGMAAFGRPWDETDMESMRIALRSLVEAYGKKNVAAMLNTMKDDVKTWGDYCNGSFDAACDKYGKSLTDLLK